jgi:DNA-directed RNA polymerase subunit M/transcription elongation factor TFIIS
VKIRLYNNSDTYMQETKDGLWCPKCKKLIPSQQVSKPKSIEKREATAIHIINKTKVKHVKVSQTCPRCGNNEAYRWFSRVSGEHAGIRRERTIEHFRCTKCSHSWSKTS